MAAVWVAEFDGSLLVRADTITAIRSGISGVTALVSVKTTDGTSIVVKKKDGVSTPGENYDEAAVRQEARNMAAELVQQITQAGYQAQAASHFQILDYTGQQVANA
jgi:ribosomal protein S3AE